MVIVNIQETLHFRPSETAYAGEGPNLKSDGATERLYVTNNEHLKFRMHPSLKASTAKYDKRIGELSVVLGEGGYACVFSVNQETVLKCTSCLATKELYSTLADSNVRVPGLPAVYRHLGVVATDSDRMPFDGYYMERLVEPLGRNQRRLHNEVVQCFAEHLKGDEGLFDPTVSIQLAEECIRTDRFSLGQAFQRILPILKRTPSILDLARPSNIMFSMKGDLSLADPVATLWI